MLSELSIFGQTTSWLEIVAILTGIVSVYLTVTQSIYCFPSGIVNVLLYAFIFFSPDVRLYSDGILQCIFAILLVYGWIQWSSKKDVVVNPIKIDVKTALRLLLITIVATIILSYFMSTFTNAVYPVLDASLTCLSLAAQWMIAKKFLENWIVWIFVDIIYIPLYFERKLPLTSVLYLIFLVLAVKGYLEWKKKVLVNAE